MSDLAHCARSYAASCAVTLQTVRLQSTALPISAPSVEAVTAAAVTVMVCGAPAAAWGPSLE